MRRALGQRGTVIVEFAIVAPVLVILVLGIADLASTTIAKFRSSTATQTAADLATQVTNLQTSDMIDIFAGAADVMAPLSAIPLQLRITSVASNGKGTAFVHWSCGTGALSPYPAKTIVDVLPSGTPVDNVLYRTDPNSTNTSFIGVETQYIYSAPTRFLLKSPQTMASTFITLPRQSAYVGFPWDGTVSHQPTAPAFTTGTASVTLANGAVCSYAY